MATFPAITIFDKLWAPSLALTLSLAIFSLGRIWIKQSHISGPILASISNFPRLSWAYSSKAHIVHIKLHEQHGDLVRIGPNCISVGDPREISKIYGIAANFKKVKIFITKG